jgi:hypothetical protein
MYLGVKELIGEKSEVSLGASYWTRRRSCQSLGSRHRLESSPDCCGVYYGTANIFSVSAPEQALTHEYGLTAENAGKRALALLENDNV